MGHSLRWTLRARRGALTALALLLAPAAALALQVGSGGAAGGGQGGSYRGPGDTVPPGNPGGAARPPNAPPPGDSRGSPSGAGGGLGAPTAPPVPPPGMGPLPGDPESPETPDGRPPRSDPDSWQLWWHYNRWAHLGRGSGALATTGSAGYFLGRGSKEQRPLRLNVTARDQEEHVRPALLALLEEGGPGELRAYVLHALAKVRDLEPAPDAGDFGIAARRHLRDANQHVAEQALLAIGVRGDSRFFALLASTLEDGSLAHEVLGRTRVPARMRAFAAYALGLLGAHDADPALRQAIHLRVAAALASSGDEDVQAAALFAIGLVPLAIAPPGDALAYETPGAEDGGRSEQARVALAALVDSDLSPRVRAMAPQAMARLLVDAPEPMRALVARALLASVEAHSRDPYEVRNGAILALGAIGRSGSAPLDQEIRRDLERLAFRSGGARLTGYLATVALAQAASRAGEGELPFEGLEPTRKALLRQLTLSRGQTLCWNALALGLLEERAAERGKVPSSDSAAALRTVLRRNRSSEVLGAAAIALGLMRDVEAQELLVARMSEAGEQHARGYAALALGMIGAHGAREAVLAALEASTQQPFALEQVGIALSLLGDQVTGLRLFELLDLDPSPELQVALASALGWIQDPRPLVPLCGRVADRGLSRHARAWSAVAVGRICDVDDPAWVGRVSVGVNYDVALRTLIDPEYGTGLLDQP